MVTTIGYDKIYIEMGNYINPFTAAFSNFEYLPVLNFPTKKWLFQEIL